ncbi:mpv17-like protein isoform X2 [Ixodes scapularis]|uniref:mpv17-like protein isoform X2 n=1 Tax=Ixodes scapularis TaxID=6945 RepID=UPI001A9EADB7|nr:mpv17-like protein isoform X2 [Ixodes scapularis]
MQSVRTLFKKRPLVANVVSFGSMYVGAELVQQTILQKLDPSVRGYDVPLVGRYAVIGTGIYAPALFYWYRYLDRVLPGKIAAVAVRKALIDQVCASSALLVAFYSAMSAMEGKEDLFAELKQKFWPTYKLSCCFWIPAQCVNFFLVPPHLRVVTVGICSFAWVNILCIMKRMHIAPQKQDP